jgi:hypothetical protein
MAYENHWLPGFNFNVEEWFEGDATRRWPICRSLELALAAFAVAVAEKPAGHFMIRSRSGSCSDTRRAAGDRAQPEQTKKAAGKRRKPAALSLQRGSRQGREPGGSQ